MRTKWWGGIIGMLAVTIVLWGVLAATPDLRPMPGPLPPPDWRFGAIETYESPAAAGQLGVAWTRVTFHWGEMQPDGPADWLPPLTAEQLRGEQAREVTGLIIGLPGWARDENNLPAGLYLSPDDPGNLWANFVRQLVGRYAAEDIHHWVIWNEPDIWDKETPGHTWDGTEEDFAQLLRVAYLVAKQENPRAVIHLPAFTYFWDANYGREQYMRRLLDVLVADPEAAAHNHYFDIATAHLYFQPGQIFDVLLEFQDIMAAHGLQKPIWLMETNAPPIDDPAWIVESPTLLVTQEEQAAFMPQVIATALAAGAERIGVFKLIDNDTDPEANPEPFGLVRMDGSPRPAFDTYQLALQYLSGVQAATRERWDAVGQFRLDQGDYATTVVFARLPEPQLVQIPATADTAIWASMWGDQEEITARNGLFEVIVPPARCAQYIGTYCMIGGETYYLVQANPGGERPIFLPNQRQSPRPDPLPTATAATEPTITASDFPPTLVVPSPPPAETAPPATAPPSPETAPASTIMPPEENRPENFPLSYLFIGAAFLLGGTLVLVFWSLRQR